MSDSRALVLFEDARAGAWEPFATTRAVCTLRYGALPLGVRTVRALDLPLAAVLGPHRLNGIPEEGMPAVTAYEAPPSEGPRVFLSSRAVLEPFAATTLPDRATLRVGGRLVGWVLPDGEVPPPEAMIGGEEGPVPFPGQGADVTIPGEVLEWPWKLMEGNGARLHADLAGPPAGRGEGDVLRPPDHVTVLGAGLLSLGEGVELEPQVVLDTRNGPIRLEAGVTVRAFTRLSGPAWVGPGTVLLGGEIGASTIGRGCRVRGEVSDCVLDDFVNKAHDGHLGHAMVGRWVNLGADTTNSDLKNSYGTVRVRGPGAPLDTGLLKVGCFLGDHVKTGIGTLLPTGGVVGAGSNVFGGGMAPAYVPAFQWRGPDGGETYDLKSFLAVARRAMGRRGVELDGPSEQVLQRAWQEAEGG
jgi:UDP-N-acetylglucosamine diphosphorylase/glucosamine-1-phosphate N-acetyltransferase